MWSAVCGWGLPRIVKIKVWPLSSLGILQMDAALWSVCGNGLVSPWPCPKTPAIGLRSLQFFSMTSCLNGLIGPWNCRQCPAIGIRLRQLFLSMTSCLSGLIDSCLFWQRPTIRLIRVSAASYSLGSLSFPFWSPYTTSRSNLATECIVKLFFRRCVVNLEIIGETDLAESCNSAWMSYMDFLV